MVKELIQKINNTINGAGETLKTIGETAQVNSQRKKMLKGLLQNSTNKEYIKRNGQSYPGPDDTLLMKDRPTQEWNSIYSQMKNKYKNLNN